jgi:hypothetical protein
MTPTLTAAGTLDPAALRQLGGTIGPCLTLVVPAHRPGAAEAPPAVVYRGLLKMAGDRLAAGSLARQAQDLLAPLEELGRDPVLEKGGAGWAVFRAPGSLACCRVNTDEARLSIASHFLLSPFVAEAFVPPEYFALGLGAKHLRLFQCARGACSEVPLPEGVPASLEAAEQFRPPDHSLENRSTAGSSVGHMRVRFTTLAEREAAGAYLHDYFEIVDRGLQSLLAGRPLVLMGVPEDIAVYRRAARNPERLLAGSPGSVQSLTPAEIGARARETMLAEYERRGDAVLAGLLEKRDRRRVATDIRAVLDAAAQGRVQRLCYRTGTEWIGPMERGLDRVHGAGEDLVNACVAETLRSGGEVFAVPQDRLPADRPVAAVLYYS